VTAIRKLHTPRRAGLLEASLAGLFLALFQFMAAMTYPRIVYALSSASDERVGFLTTWGLIAVFSIVFSMVGAILGHMAFAPLRPPTLRNKASQIATIDEQEEDHLASSEEEQVNDLKGMLDEEEEETNTQGHSAIDVAEAEMEDEDVETAASIVNKKAVLISPQRSLVSYFITILLLGLFPTLVGYVFAAAFDYMLQVYRFFPGPYPTLRLLSALLPWQVPIVINLHSSDPNASIFLLWQLWRIPLFLGNPTMFDVQALEPFVFNAAALGLLLLTLRNSSADSKLVYVPWSTYLLLEVLLGLILVFPADLWVLRGLQGLLQYQQIVMPIRTLHILNTPTFILNLITGLLICAVVGVAVRLLQKRWTLGQR